MNIALVSPYLAERFGGSVVLVKKTGAALAALGHNVSYWAICEETDQQELASINSAHLYDVARPYSWYYSKGLSQGMSAKTNSLDIIHITQLWPHPVYAASRIARARNIPYVLSPAGSLEPWRLKSTLLKWLKKKAYLSLVGKSIMRNAACLHAASLQEAEHFRLVGYSGSIAVIQHGVDTNEFNLGDGARAEACWPELKGRQVVLFLSRLSPEKGLDQLVPAWADIVRQKPKIDALLVIAGPDDKGYASKVKKMVKSHSLQSHVLFTGIVRGEKKIAIYQRADVFVLPSYSENFGLVITEALACGTPVVTTTGTPWKGLLDADAGRWVAPERGALAEALRELLLLSKGSRKKMGERGRKLVLEDYSWESAARRLLTVYKCIVEGKDVPLYPEPAKT